MITDTVSVEPERIACLAARIAKVSPVAATTPFALIGLDSVGTIELIATVEREFGVSLPTDTAVACRDARALARAVDVARSDKSTASTACDESAAMRADAILPTDIVPARKPSARPRGMRDARAILLTGVTGFLGRWIARELIATSDATLLCVVRQRFAMTYSASAVPATVHTGRDHAATRVRDSLRSTGLDERTIATRVRVISGDLSEPWLGLTATDFADLANDIDAVCHAGADVNWVLPYRALKPTNVDGTLTLLRLASMSAAPLHFVSSLSVCYGVSLGYAQTKTVCESLVREAGRRGLPVTIYRPSLVAGHSVTGAFNADDLLSRIVAGCVRMGTVPDLDWTMDCVPVDELAHDIVNTSIRRGLFALRHPRPRQWRECVLWMRLCGYDVRLIPYHAWLAQLEREIGPSGDLTHPLRPLRGFFFAQPSDSQPRTLPELMLTTAVDKEGEPSSHAYTNLDAALLQRYFDAFVATGGLPPPRRARHTASPTATCHTGTRPVPLAPSNPLDEAFFARAIGARVTRVESLGRLSDHSIIGELTSWNAGRPTGLFSYRLHLDGETHRDVLVKIKARDRDAIAVGEALARLCGDDIGDAYARSADRLGLLASHERELAIYDQYDPRFVARVPRVLATVRDDASGTWMVVLERISGAVLKDAVDDPRLWTDEHVDCAVRGLAALQAIWFDRDAELRAAPWIGYASSTADVRDMSDLWTTLTRHAASRFAAWGHPTLPSVQHQLIDRIDEWRAPLDTAPRTLIHHDFNPRNICITRNARDGSDALVVYDWELATIGAPQRDLAELLCFVLPSDVSFERVNQWIERHRLMLEQQTGRVMNAVAWREGFRASLFDVMLMRLPMYALIHRVRPQSFLPRVVRTWWTLYQSLRS
jgi:thioester reductase-like protein